MSRLVSVSISALAAIALISPARLFAEQHTFVLDPERTSLTFALGATGHDVHGLLHATGGAVSFDTETGAASGEITLDARHTETGNRKRDKTMHRISQNHRIVLRNNPPESLRNSAEGRA